MVRKTEGEPRRKGPRARVKEKCENRPRWDSIVAATGWETWTWILQKCELVQCLLLAHPFSDTPKMLFLQPGRFKRVIQNEPIARDTT